MTDRWGAAVYIACFIGTPKSVVKFLELSISLLHQFEDADFNLIRVLLPPFHLLGRLSAYFVGLNAAVLLSRLHNSVEGLVEGLHPTKNSCQSRGLQYMTPIQELELEANSGST
ncbi:unnamed protein product [Calypogeia fissa]